MAHPSDRPPNRSATERTSPAAPPAASAPDERTRVVAPTGNGPAIVALVLGLLAATFAFLGVTVIAAIIFGIVAIAFGVKGMSTAKTYGGLYNGLAITGVVSGALGLLLGIAVIAGALTLGEQIDLEDLPQEVQDTIEDATN